MYRWTKKDYDKLCCYLKQHSEDEYRLFQQKIIFTNYSIIGVRTPILHKVSKEIAKTDVKSFLKIAKDLSFEEVLLQGLVIATIKDDNVAFPYFEHFISKIDNWALCDMVVSRMKIIKKYQEKYWPHILTMLENQNQYVVRVGIILLLDYYLEEDYLPLIFSLLDNLKREEYYINMAIAWLLSIGYIHYPHLVKEYLLNCHLSNFTYNKTIQKIIESRQVSAQEKDILRQMKRS